MLQLRPLLLLALLHCALTCTPLYDHPSASAWHLPLLLTPVQGQSTITWSTLNQTSLSALQPSDIAGASANDLGSIPVAACPGFTAALLGAASSNSPYNQCSGFSSACLAVIPATAFSQLNDECTGSFTANGLGGITSDSVKQMPASGFALITYTNLAGLTSGCAGITPAQVAQLATNSPYDACSGLQAGCVSVAPSNFLSQLNPNCASSMNTAAITQMTAGQFGAIPSAAIAVLTQAQVTVMTTACGGLTVDQAQQLGANSPYTTCAGFTATCLKAVPAEAFGGFSGNCVISFSGDALSEVDSTQIGQMSANNGLGYLTVATLNGIASSACSGFTSPQLAVLGSNSPYTTCQGFTPACLAALTPGAAAGFLSGCIYDIPVDAITGLTASSVTYLTGSAVGGITQQQAAVLSSGCSGFTSQQTVSFGALSPYMTCAGFTSACLGLFTTDALSQLSPGCTYLFTNEAVSAWTSQQVGALSPTAAGGLSADGISGISAQGARGFTSAQLTALQSLSPYNSCTGFKQAALASIVGAASGFSPSCISNIPAKEIVGLTLQALQNLTPTAISGFLYPQLGALVQVYYQAFVDNWSVAQGNGITSYVMAQWNSGVEAGTIPADESWTSNTDLTQISQLQLSTCKVACMNFLFASTATPNTLPAVSWGGMRSDLVQAIGPASSSNTVVGQISWLSSVQSWYGWPVAAIGALSASQVASLPPTTVAVLDPSSFSPSAMAGLSDADIKAIPANMWQNVGNNCPNWQAMSYHQQQYLFNIYLNAYDTLVQDCGPAYTSTGGGPVLPSSSSGSQPIMTSSSSGSGGSTSTGTIDPNPSSGLSPGAIAGIVIGCLVGVTVAAVLFWYCCLRTVTPQSGYVNIV